MHEDWLLFLGMSESSTRVKNMFPILQKHPCCLSSRLFMITSPKRPVPHISRDMITGSFFVGLSWTSNLNVDLEFYMQLYALQIWPIFSVYLHAILFYSCGSWNHVMVQVSSHRFYAVSPPAIMFGTAFFPKQKPPQKVLLKQNPQAMQIIHRPYLYTKKKVCYNLS